MSESQRIRISLYLDLAKYPELAYLQAMGSGRSSEALRLMAIGKRHEDYVVKQMSDQLGGLSSPDALREIMFNPSSVLNRELEGTAQALQAPPNPEQKKPKGDTAEPSKSTEKNEPSLVPSNEKEKALNKKVTNENQDDKDGLLGSFIV